MIYLSENEVGFHDTALGYPSIRGCHAIAYVTSNGLFGLHNFGGDLERDWAERSDIFAEFVTRYPGGPGVGKTLYGVCYATTQRAYSGLKSNWKGELEAFARKLKFNGSIYGYDLAARGFLPPAYVHIEKVGDTCVLQVKPWNKADSGEGANMTPTAYQMFGRNPNGEGYALKRTKQAVVTSMTTAGLATVYPEKLR